MKDPGNATSTRSNQPKSQDEDGYTKEYEPDKTYITEAEKPATSSPKAVIRLLQNKY